MSCDYCWPGNCCGGPNCKDAKPMTGPTDAEYLATRMQEELEKQCPANTIGWWFTPVELRFVIEAVRARARPAAAEGEDHECVFQDAYVEISGVVGRQGSEAHSLADDVRRLVAERDEARAQNARDEEHYQAAMAMSEKHRKLWVEASQERDRMRAALLQCKQGAEYPDELGDIIDAALAAQLARPAPVQGEEEK